MLHRSAGMDASDNVNVDVFSPNYVNKYFIFNHL